MARNGKLQTSKLDGFQVVSIDVTIGFQQFSDNFSDRSTIIKAKKVRFSTSYISEMPSPISFKLQNMFNWSSFNALHQNWTERKMLNFLVHSTFQYTIIDFQVAYRT